MKHTFCKFYSQSVNIILIYSSLVGSIFDLLVGLTRPGRRLDT